MSAFIRFAAVALLLISVGQAREELDPKAINDAFLGDLSAMADRGVIRIGTTFSRTNFFLEEGRPRGATWEVMERFEGWLREHDETLAGVRVILVPLQRNALVDSLLEGRVDLLAANLSITPERAEQVTFSVPLASGVRELVVTGPAGATIETIDDLAGQPIHVRASSSYRESLESLAASFRARGLAPPEVVFVDELLETEDILELVAAGVFPTTIADGGLAHLWGEVLPQLVVHEDLAIKDGISIGWAMRPDSSELKRTVDAFVAEHRQGTLFGNIIIKRYFQDNRWVRNPLGAQDRVRFDEVSGYFQEYAEQYGLDWLLSAAQGFQESRFDQSMVSPAGAVGIMQLLPSTAADSMVGIPDIEVEEKNIHAGIKYKSRILERYFDDPAIHPVDQHLFALAAYNAGPRRIRDYRARAAERGFDPNRWFRNVELVSNAETRTYVANIFKYYVAYRLYVQRRDALQERLGTP